MEENRYRINWLGLFIKVIIFVVIALLAIWLVTKVTSKNKGLSIDENSKLFTDAAVEYFRVNLPEDENSKTVTLSQLITWDYIEELTNEKGKICDIKKSKAKIEQIDDYYSIKTEIICGNDSKTNYIKLGSLECQKCDVKIEGLQITNKNQEDKQENQTEQTPSPETSTNSTTNNSITSNNSTTPNNNTTSTNSTPETSILYEYVKKIDEYSDWYIGKVTGNNIENSTKSISYSKYCQNEEYNYYTVSYVSEKKKYTYTLELKNYQDTTSQEITDNYFSTLEDYQNYIDYRNQNLTMIGGNPNAAVNITSASKLRASSLTANNFTYTISNIYKNQDKYYVDITIKIKNLKNVTPYYASNIKKKIYFVPIKFTISSDSNNCITDKTENSNQYPNYKIVDTWNEYIDIYRYKITVVEYKYSNQESLPGYTKTGNYKQVNK